MFVSGAGISAAELAFPGAAGFAATTPGGRGGRIIRVTTLAPKGKGSLDEALRAKGARIIVFEVGGVIDLAGSTLTAREPFVTIAGQTAPSPGITLIKGSINISTHDVIMQHIRIRPGEAGHAKKSGWEADGVATIGASNVIIDHCSCTWATDENLSESGERFKGDTVDEWRKNTSRHITLSNCIIAECLSRSTHGKGEHSKGTLLHDNTTNIAVIGNLFASNVERNPLAKGGVHAVIVNNWIFNPGKQAIHHALVPDEWKPRPLESSRLCIVGNVLEHGPDTQTEVRLFMNYAASPLELFMEDNLAFDRDHQPLPVLRDKSLALARERPLWPDKLMPIPASDVKAHVAREVGARPWDRDPIDRRIVEDALAGKGRIIHSEQEAGGYPDVKETRMAFLPEMWLLDSMTPVPPR
jgi:pectate lyase